MRTSFNATTGDNAEDDDLLGELEELVGPDEPGEELDYNWNATDEQDFQDLVGEPSGQMEPPVEPRNYDDYFAKYEDATRRLNKLYAQLHVCYVAHCNRVGFEDGVNFWGGSEIVGPDGTVLARAPDFKEALVVATLHDAELRRQRARLPLRRDENVGINGREFARIAAQRHRANDD